MTARPVSEASLRPGRLELSRLGWALGISLVFHLFCFGGYEVGRHFGFWEALRVPAWLQKSKILASVLEEEKRAAQQPAEPQWERDPPLMFVDVNPQLATPEPPKNPRFQSSLNSQAANLDIDKESDVPKIAGKQTDIVKAEDVNRSKFDRLQPVFPQAETEQPAEQAKPKTPQPPGDLAMAKPETELRKEAGTAEKSRPRTVEEAKARKNRNQLAGEKMKQEGGVPRLGYSGLDTKATLTGSYDAAFIEAVENRWFSLLDNMNYDGYRRGRVVLKFRLVFDGRITDMEVVENTVGESLGLLCQKAILDPAPFERWPREVRRMVDKDFREIQFAFYYN